MAQAVQFWLYDVMFDVVMSYRGAVIGIHGSAGHWLVFSWHFYGTLV